MTLEEQVAGLDYAEARQVLQTPKDDRYSVRVAYRQEAECERWRETMPTHDSPFMGRD